MQNNGKCPLKFVALAQYTDYMDAILKTEQLSGSTKLTQTQIPSAISLHNIAFIFIKPV